jgi:hypothetical protein
MKEKIKQYLNNKSIHMGNIGKTIEKICTDNNAKLKSVNADLGSCILKIETEEEKFNIDYTYFDPVSQYFVFK